MRLAQDEMTVTVGDERFHLRPTLRAAFRLERRYHGFDPLICALIGGSLSAVADVIAESSDRCSNISDVLKAIEAMPLKLGIESLTGPALNHVMILAGLDEAEPKPSTNRITFAEYHTQLFGIATGWLGWTPETAWNATAAEILEAYKGRQEMIGQTLRAVFGDGSDTHEQEMKSGPVVHTEAEIQESRAALRHMTATGQNVGA